MNDAPIEPSADLRTFANQMRQMFVALVAEGFTRDEALVVIGHVISSVTGGDS